MNVSFNIQKFYTNLQNRPHLFCNHGSQQTMDKKTNKKKRKKHKIGSSFTFSYTNKETQRSGSIFEMINKNVLSKM